MTKAELIEMMKDYPDDAEVVIVDTVNRWSIDEVLFEPEEQVILLV